MLDIFGARPVDQEAADAVDLIQLIDRLGEMLAEAGLRPDTRTFNAVHKMLADDLIWYFQKAATPESLKD